MDNNRTIDEILRERELLDYELESLRQDRDTKLVAYRQQLQAEYREKGNGIRQHRSRLTREYNDTCVKNAWLDLNMLLSALNNGTMDFRHAGEYKWEHEVQIPLPGCDDKLSPLWDAIYREPTANSEIPSLVAQLTGKNQQPQYSLSLFLWGPRAKSQHLRMARHNVKYLSAPSHESLLKELENYLESVQGSLNPQKLLPWRR
jgi:hypothetical protein